MRFGRGRRVRPPDAVATVLERDEVVTGLVTDDTGTRLAATRRRLLVLPDREGAEPVSVPWYQISRVRLDSGVLEVVTLERLGDFAVRGDLVMDAPAVRFVVGRPARLTDQVHQRVRASVAAAERLTHPDGGGWVTLRRIAGQDGLLPQFRIDQGTDPASPGLLPAAEQLLARVQSTPAAGTTGADD